MGSRQMNRGETLPNLETRVLTIPLQEYMFSAQVSRKQQGKYDFGVVDKSVAQNGDFDHHKGLVFKILNITGGFNTKVLYRHFENRPNWRK